MTKHHLLSPYNWICGIFSKFVMVNSNDKKESTGECSSTLSQGSVLLHLVGFTFPFFSWYASSNWWRFQYLVVPLPPCGLPLLGCMVAWTLVLVRSFFFFPLLGCFLFTFSGPVLVAFFFLFIKLERVSSQSRFWTIHIYFLNVWIIFSIWDSKEQR